MKSFIKKPLNSIKYFFKNKFLIFTFFIIALKCIIFLGFVNSPNAIGFINYTKTNPFLILVDICFTLILVSFAYLFKGIGQYIYLFILNLSISTILFFDLCYYRGFNAFISPYLLSESANLNNLSDSITSLTRRHDYIFFVDIVLILVIFIVLRIKSKLHFDVKRSIPAFIIVFAIPLIIIYTMHVQYDIKQVGKKINRYIFVQSWVPIGMMDSETPLGYHLNDTYTYFRNINSSLSSSDKKKIANWFKKKQENLPDNNYKGMFKGKNLIIIQHESLENFVIGRKIDGQEITPNLNNLVKNSIYFNNYHEQVNQGVTSDAEFMTNTSVYPLRSGCVFFTYPKNTYNSLPKLMQSIGYSTTAIHPDHAGYWNWMTSLESIGYQKCFDASNFNQNETIGLGMADGSFFKQVEPIIKNRKKPFLTYMITLSSHMPFDLPQKYRKLKLSNNLDPTYLGGYFQSVHYTDEAIGNFMKMLDKDGILDNTVVVIYGDHTGVHKYYQSEVNNIKPSQNWWMNGNTEVPLIIYSKGMKPQVVSIYGGQIDLLPTITYLMGIPSSKIANTAMGRNLLNTKRNFCVLDDKTYLGKDSPYKNYATDGLDIADKMVRGNYFKNYFKK